MCESLEEVPNLLENTFLLQHITRRERTGLMIVPAHKMGAGNVYA